LVFKVAVLFVFCFYLLLREMQWQRTHILYMNTEYPNNYFLWLQFVIDKYANCMSIIFFCIKIIGEYK